MMNGGDLYEPGKLTSEAIWITDVRLLYAQLETKCWLPLSLFKDRR